MSTPNRSYTKAHWFLLSSLMAVVGFSISWNPENTQIARYEVKPGEVFGEIMMASVDPNDINLVITDFGKEPVVMKNGKIQKNIDGKWVDDVADADKKADAKTEAKKGVTTYKIDLKGFDKLKGLKATAVVNEADRKIMYKLEGQAANTCGGCLKTQVLTNLSATEISDISALTMLIGANAEDLVGQSKKEDEKEQKESRVARERREKREKDREELEDKKCHNKDKDSRLECQKDELLAMVNQCEKMSEKKEKECLRKSEAYYRKYVKSSLTRGLAAGADSDSLDTAMSVRDDLITELEDARFDGIKRDLVNMTKNGTMMRAKNVYDSCLMGGSMMMGVGAGGCTPGMAAIQAKQSMMKELSNTPDSVGGRLREALLNANSENPLTLQNMYMSHFQKPLYDFWQRDSRNGIAANEWGLNGIDGLGVPGLGQPGLAPTDLLDVRANAYRGTRQVPNAFGQARQGGAGVPAVPGGQFGGRPGFNNGPGFQQQGPNGFQQSNGFQGPGYGPQQGFRSNGPGAYNPGVPQGPGGAPNISGFGGGPTFYDQSRPSSLSVPNVPTGPTGSRTRY